MEKFVLNNGIRLLYEHRESYVTSFCIGFDAGANAEVDFKLGTAHALEHMLFKGTTTLDEDEINLKCDRLFGFNNAMTNFPYCIYYGTSSNEDFVEAFSLYSDIILNPALSEVGFKEEMDVILQEFNEWKEDFGQYCEDELFYNSYERKRLKNIIIGTEVSIKEIHIDELKRFYKRYYVPENCVISVITSISFEDIKTVVNNIFSDFKGEYIKPIYNNESISSGIHYKEVSGFEGAKIQYVYDISMLDTKEVEALRIFNMWLGEGVSSRLFDKVRTKGGLAYEIFSAVKNEANIKLFSINCSTSKNSVDRCIDIIDLLVDNAVGDFQTLTQVDINYLIKRLKLKRALDLEKSIVLANRLTIYELMYKRGKMVFDELEFEYEISNKDIINVIKKVFVNPSKQVLW
ncbi:M16 family metallopeptidase [Clostridium folliculivorans]|uniref:Peptidase M16 n=1 Tax=Clostridium folliculivorans TaxID=2886038 RepID=A0A9W5XYZ9_9CLOT|nr:pitrilysin family protein [Clostridium folliculivorans]GKU23532.1 peptidase M16 [Clostridium folliculivorans]GKU29648.1 peptidase M16 [Clostridium folliculivorans]